VTGVCGQAVENIVLLYRRLRSAPSCVDVFLLTVGRRSEIIQKSGLSRHFKVHRVQSLSPVTGAVDTSYASRVTASKS